MFIINLFHINIKNFHNNDRPNKTTLIVLSQLTITKVNIIEKFGKENNKITSKNARILKRKENERKREREREIIFYYAFCLPQWSSYCCLNFESF